jgi:hypothetical protein
MRKNIIFCYLHIAKLRTFVENLISYYHGFNAGNFCSRKSR